MKETGIYEECRCYKSFLKVKNIFGFSLLLIGVVVFFLFCMSMKIFPSNLSYLIAYFFLLIGTFYFLTSFSKKLIKYFFFLFFDFKPVVADSDKVSFYTGRGDEVKYLLNEDDEDKKKEKVIFFVLPLTLQTKNKKDVIGEKFLELAFFWYATKTDKVKFRFFLPFLSFITTGIIFLAVLFLLDRMDFGLYWNNIVKMSLVILFLITMYFSMIYHINIFLNPDYYKHELYKLFKEKKINFLDDDPSKNILLFLDKNFLIKVYDQKRAKDFFLNSSKSFEDFILKEEIDKEAKEYITNIFVSLFMIVFVTIFVEVLVDEEIDKRLKYYDEYKKIESCQNKKDPAAKKTGEKDVNQSN